ncbi:DUF2076 domain-containing protein [Pigmentiphaga aceris]|uniref:DUF2076 domain-containing protein n=1 Tax=Pigmentiphaga aceris TaxID=1940612 RepID=A0A5C0AW03_9BURK|nr:DUF2076 domain-containing protein [Pigmentiphaga aceris]QEI06559.1 DUF2076 domain-containing protein [Pigmentiphaga aceris]
MNNEDRIAIEGVFSRLQEVERQGGPREPEAEQFIRSRIDAQPGAAYYLAQTVLVQEHALKSAQQKITELEQRAAAPAPAPAPQAGFAADTARPSGLSGLSAGFFGRSPPASQQGSQPLSAAGTPLSAAGTPLQGGTPPVGSQFGQSAQPAQPQAPSRAGGFLAGAAHTAMGVAGGMMLGSMLGNMFGGGADKTAEAAAAEAKPEPTADAGAQSDSQFDTPNDAPSDVAYDNSDSGFGFFDDGGDFDEV